MKFKGRDPRTGLAFPDIEAMQHDLIMKKTNFILKDIERTRKQIKELTKQVESRLNKEGKSLFKLK